MKLIDKDALVAEIERRLETIANTPTDNLQVLSVIKGTQHYELINLIQFLDTLEVKEVDFEKDVRQILSLYYEGIKHYDDIIKEERNKNGGSDLAIKIMDGVVDARELGIQYVIDKLKAHKGE